VSWTIKEISLKNPREERSANLNVVLVFGVVGDIEIENGSMGMRPLFKVWSSATSTPKKAGFGREQLWRETEIQNPQDRR
jgi:hypothetical protein